MLLGARNSENAPVALKWRKFAFDRTRNANASNAQRRPWNILEAQVGRRLLQHGRWKVHLLTELFRRRFWHGMRRRRRNRRRHWFCCGTHDIWTPWTSREMHSRTDTDKKEQVYALEQSDVKPFRVLIRKVWFKFAQSEIHANLNCPSFFSNDCK